MAGNTTYKRDQVVGIINSVLSKIRTPQHDTSHEYLTRELIELRDIIENLRNQLQATKAGDIGQSHIPTATDELDAVIDTTEKATQEIMGSCESILETMKGQPEAVAKQIENNVVKIFESCTFQDITGQRIKKVVKCLKEIESKTASILEAIECELGDITSSKEEAGGKIVSLLNGPALPLEAVSQADIDKLLAEFDNNSG